MELNKVDKTRILVVEDDVGLCELYRLYFGKEGYDVVIANNGRDGLKKVNDGNFNLILLDVMMPEMDGIETLVQIRQKSRVPVIMVSAKGAMTDVVGGLDFGADDYITKPFEMIELISRIKAVLRRSVAVVADQNADIVVGNLSVSIKNYIVKISGARVEMPPKEIELLYYFVTNPMYVFSREQLLENVWKDGYSGDTRTVDVHIKRIREKLGVGTNWRFSTVWGKGYKFEIDS